MLDLPQLTIWTMVWNEDKKYLHRCGQVLRYCEQIIKCPRVLFYAGKLGGSDYPWQTVQIPKLDWQGYNMFINRVIPQHIKTDFAMSVHEDGFPIRPDLWNPKFLEYDYIGAPWDDLVVGNGGFSIESQRLLSVKSNMPLTSDDFSVPSDRLICTTRRAWLEERGIKFAPLDLALQFSTEQIHNERASFGFHGRRLSPQKYAEGWLTIQNYRTMQATTRKDGFTLVRNQVVPPPRKPPPHILPRVAPTIPLTTNPRLQSVPIRTVLDLNFPPATPDCKVTVVYVYPLVAGNKYHWYADRFVQSYADNPPGRAHDTMIVANGGRWEAKLQAKFEKFPGVQFFRHDNSGYDLGAFQMASRLCPSDLIVFLGASTYLNGQGWLKRMVDASVKHGNALYGAMGNRGDARYSVWPHIRTTAFWMHPKLFNAHPKRVTKNSDRHAFEHGAESFTGWVTQHGLKAWVVTWAGEYEWANWDDDPNGFQRGDQSSLLAGDHITEEPYYSPRKRV